MGLKNYIFHPDSEMLSAAFQLLEAEMSVLILCLRSRNKRRWMTTVRPPLSPSQPFLSIHAVPHLGTTFTQQSLSEGLSCLREWFHVNAHLSAANKTQSWCYMGARRAGIVAVGRWTVGSTQEKG